MFWRVDSCVFCFELMLLIDAGIFLIGEIESRFRTYSGWTDSF